jgi:hypothetical protein
MSEEIPPRTLGTLGTLNVPAHVHCGQAPEGGAVLLNTRTGQWHVLNRTARELWEECRSTGDFHAAVAAVSTRLPPAHAERLRSDADAWARTLLDRGLLTHRRPASEAPPRSGSPPEPPPDAVEHLPPVSSAPSAGHPPPDGHASPMAGPTGHHTSADASVPVAVGEGLPARPALRRDRVAAVLGFVLALCLLRLPFRGTLRAVAVLKRLLGRRAATREQAERAVRAVPYAARRHPGRVACLELSLGAVMMLALTGRSLHWCLGSTGDLLRFHAWVEVDHAPVAPPGDPDADGPFHEVLRA